MSRRLLVSGVPVEHRVGGTVRTSLAWLVDWDNPSNNDWLAVNQFTVVGTKERRPDVVVFVNGLPLGLVELKNPGAEQTTVRGAWHQVQTYRADIPAIFTPNAVCVVSDGMGARTGSLSAAKQVGQAGGPRRRAEEADRRGGPKRRTKEA